DGDTLAAVGQGTGAVCTGRTAPNDDDVVREAHITVRQLGSPLEFVRGPTPGSPFGQAPGDAVADELEERHRLPHPMEAERSGAVGGHGTVDERLTVGRRRVAVAEGHIEHGAVTDIVDVTHRPRASLVQR